MRGAMGLEVTMLTIATLLTLLLVAKRIISWKAGAIPLILFITHLPFLDPDQRLIFALIYFGLAAALLLYDFWRRDFSRLRMLFKE